MGMIAGGNTADGRLLLMYGDNAALIVATWGPSLVLLFTVLLVALLARNLWRRTVPIRPSRRGGYVVLSSGRPDELDIALKGAADLNSYNIHAQNNPSVHLGAAVRFTPLDYQSSVPEIMQSFREGRVVSIDLGSMDRHQAARLVDFCSGLTAVDSGWIFQVTDKVIVLTPLT